MTTSTGHGQAPQQAHRQAPLGSDDQSSDVVVVGGGHNGLVAAAYLARAGLSVLVLERLPRTGGAAVSEQAFAGHEARLSRYSYLVSLLPRQIIDDLGLDIELRSRRTASYSPVVRGGRHTGLLIERPESTQTAQSFRLLTGSTQEYDAWRRFYGEVTDMAQMIAPTLLEPLRSDRDLRARMDDDLWDSIIERPLGDVIEDRFRDDTVRGVVATDGLIGTFADLRSESLLQNRCFLYHVIGNGTGEWRVPVGGMGALTDALRKAAVAAGARILTEAPVTAIASDGTTAQVTWRDGDAERTVETRFVLSNVAPVVLDELVGRQPRDRPMGSQLKINLLLSRLPRLRSGADPRVAFAGTFHVAEDYSQLQAAHADAASGRLPATMPGELYCHSLTDPSIVGPEAEDGVHTLTYFGVHTPANLFDGDVDGVRDEAVARALAALDEHLGEPIASCLALDAHGRPCIEAKAPQDIEAALAMPGGHIFHGDLAWPWVTPESPVETPAQRWGVETGVENVLVCGSGARRGGAVSGIGGHNAAQAVLESIVDR